MEQTPYMRLPMDCLKSRDYDSVIFVGPAQSGKTSALIEGWSAYSIVESPADLMIIHVTQDDGRDFSRARIQRMIEASPAIRARLSKFGHDDNVFDKRFKAGNFLKIGWPTPGKFRGKNIPRIAMTDYDGYPDDIGGEGSAYALAQKRTQSFMSSGMTLVETSPGWDVTDANWVKTGAHEAPPTRGALALYNQGDRHRWHWKCPDCEGWFEAYGHPTDDASVLHWDRSIADPVKASETAHVVCPHCGVVIEHGQKRQLNIDGEWFREGELQGEPRVSRMATFWMFGIAAAYQTWESLVYNHLIALRNYEQTGSHENLKAKMNVDWALPFTPPSIKEARDVAAIAARAGKTPKRQIADGVFFLTAAVDQQKRRFVVQVMGWGRDGESWLVDRYNIAESNRTGEDGKRLHIEPSAYAEDWQALDYVLDREYQFADGRVMKPVLTLCDSGGQDKATENAYGYWRRVKARGDGRRLQLIKGRDRGPTFSKSLVEQKAAKIPLWLLNVNQLKDEVDRSLSRDTPGAGYVNFPDWLGQWFYDELGAEVRSDKGWSKRSPKLNNEAFDLLGYNRAAYYILGADRINWEKPPMWAQPETAQKHEKTDALAWLRERGRRINNE